jgi:hypothetical protein
VQLAATVTLGGAKNVAGETLRVNPNQRRHVALHLTLEEDNVLLFGSQRAVGGDLKIAPFSRQTRNCDPFDCSSLN